MNEMPKDDIKNLPGVMPLKKTKTIVIKKIPETYPVYSVPLKYLYYNKENDRISTEVIRYCTEKHTNLPTEREEYNMIFEDLIVKSKKDAIENTQKSIANRGQDNPGVTLKDGCIVDGNRRFTCLRRIQRETNEEQCFETIILDFDYNNDYKCIKSLELELQMGVDEKVKYNPIDRLFGTYKSIRIEKAFTVEEYAALFDSRSVSDVKADLALADLMCEYLEFQGTPEKYYIAKDMDLEGTLHEIPSILEKVKKKNPELVDDVKTRIFSSIATGVSSTLNLFIRKIKAIVDEGNLEEYLDATNEAVEKTIEILQSNPIKSYNDLTEGIRKDDTIREMLITPVDTQNKAINSKKLKKAPVNYTKEALSTLSAIHLDSISELNDADRDTFKTNLDKLDEKISELRHKI